MKTKLNLAAISVALSLLSGLLPAAGADGLQQSTTLATGAEAEASAGTSGAPRFITRTTTLDTGAAAARESLWLGVGVEETTETLAAQLELKPGEGLVVSYVATNSPAGAADLRKNDVLVELDGQMLVDPAQLRKLVQMHAAGDNVNVTFYRAGKKQSATAKLTPKPGDELAFDGEFPPGGRAQMRFLRDLNGFAGGGGGGGVGGNLSLEIQRTMEQASKAIQDALKHLPDQADARDRLESIEKKLGNLANGGVNVGKSATVVVENKGESLRTIVKKDETGSYVIVADPAKHLTAHGPDGKLLFDGAIETPADQEKVPKDVWKEVEPMLNDLKKGPPVHGKSSGGGGGASGGFGSGGGGSGFGGGGNGGSGGFGAGGGGGGTQEE